MKFTKMHGCGNDYIYVNCIDKSLTNEEMYQLPKLVQSLSDRRNGIGADGMILIKPSEIADFGMEIYNADGTVAEMCGNGIRCVGKYVYDHKLTDEQHLMIETRVGIKELWLNVEAGKVTCVTVNMGSPILDVHKIPLNYDGELNELIDYTIHAGEEYQITCVSMGNPHAVVFVKDILRTDVKTIGQLIEHHPLFPKRTNVEFVHVIDRETIEMRVWERGTGETFACGTGACASVMAAILKDYTDHVVTVHLLGGELLIEYEPVNNTIFMTGPAVTVYEGTTVR